MNRLSHLTNSISLSVALVLSTTVCSAQITYAKKIVTGQFPFSAIQNKLMGDVSVELNVENGKVKRFKFLSGNEQLQQSNIFNRIRKWEFTSDCPKKLIINFEFRFYRRGQGEDNSGDWGAYEQLVSPNIIRIVYPMGVIDDTMSQESQNLNKKYQEPD